MRALSFVIAALLAAGSPAFAQSDLPARPAPRAMHVIDTAHGRILTGQLPVAGRPRTVADAFRTGLQGGQVYFARTMQLTSVVRSNDGSTLLGVFRARLGAAAVTGLLIAEAAGHDAQASMLFDRTATFTQSLPALSERLQAATRSTSPQAVATHVETQPVRASDGTVTAQIPQGWHVKTIAAGSLVTDGPDGAGVSMGFLLPFLDPQTPAGAATIQMEQNTGVRMALTMPYSPDPARVFTAINAMSAQINHKSAQDVHIETTRLLASTPSQYGLIKLYEIAGTQDGGGAPPQRYDALISYAPPLAQSGTWQVLISGMSAPVSRFNALAPQMLAIAHGYRPDAQRLNAQVRASVAQGDAITRDGWASVQAGIAANEQIGRQNQARVDASMASARAVQDGIDRSTAGFVNYLRGTDVVRNTSTGRDAVVTQAASDALSRFDPQHYQSVPVSRYVKGVDY